MNLPRISHILPLLWDVCVIQYYDCTNRKGGTVVVHYFTYGNVSFIMQVISNVYSPITTSTVY